ncbi:MAG: UDP-N-acetylmuramoyl-L-alanine--D-glutamate ligase [Patescibacteria group bacterium]|jgi:UDP-N-acetylmuramoylalanine--D-glutamate ligase
MPYKKIIILGYGVEGKSLYEYLRKKYPEAALAIADKKRINAPGRTKTYSGKNYLKSVGEYDLIVKSPGVSPNAKEIKEALLKGAKITSAADIFFNNCKGKIIGVTATKGKSTTATLIYKILKTAGKDVRLVGNIGNPPLKYLRRKSGQGKIFVYELSSYQLDDLKKSPHVGVFLTIFPEHLPFHGSYANYREAKANIARYQNKNDYFIYNSGYDFLKKLAKRSKAKPIDYLKICRADNQWIYYKNKKIIPLKEVRLLGRHNIENICACIAAAKIFRVSDSDIRRTVKNFKGLDHRLEFVAEHKGIRFYDDAISTTPESTMAAMDIFKKDLGTMMLGGENRGYDFSRLAKKIYRYRIENIALFPDSGAEIWKQIVKIYKKNKACLPRKINTKSMSEAVKFASKHTSQNRVCLLSTASPSYSVFKNFIEKGNLFKKEVGKLK